MAKYENIRALAKKQLQTVTESSDRWKEFLRTAAIVELFFHDRDKQDALIECLDAYDIEHTENRHRVTMFFNNDCEIAQVMDFLNRH